MSQFLGKRVLVIEDEAIIAAMVEDMLLEMGATVLGPAVTMEHGLALANTEALDAAVLDVNIRDEPVDPIAEVLRARTIPIIFATGYGEVACRLLTDEPVVAKPYTKEALGAALASVLSRAPDR
jgi:DNA-binding response OmpR family regulator